MDESDEKRFAATDGLSAVSLLEALKMLRSQFLLCKRDKLGPDSSKWMMFSSTVMRSWIARIQLEPEHTEAFERKVLFMLYWNLGVTLHQLSAGARLTRAKKLRGIERDAGIMESHLYGSRAMNKHQRQWIENGYEGIVPTIKRAILDFVPIR